MIRSIAAVMVAAGVAWSAPARAQSADPPASRIEFGIGVQWAGRVPLGDSTATETTASGGRSTLFSSSSELAGAGGLTASAAFRLTKAWQVEATASYAKPELRIALGGDTEGATPLTAVESIQQFTIGGDVLWFLPWRGARLEPFVAGGGGYLRQLHESGTLVDTGRYYDVGGGVSWLFAGGGALHTKGVGLRADVRALTRSKGVAFDGGSRTSPAAGASLFVRF